MSIEERVFSAIYNRNHGCEGETISGPGSTVLATERLRAELPKLLQELEIKTLVDAGCGDRNWIRRLDYSFDKYVGIDVVAEIINQLTEVQESVDCYFQRANIVTDVLPQGDAVS